MILYGSSFSPYVRKVIAYANEKGLELTVENTTLDSTNPEFRRASPFGKMPGFTDGDFAISDSTAIITYLEAMHPTPSMLPSDPKERGRAVWFEEFADTIMNQVTFHCFFNRIVAPIFLKQKGDEALAVKGETELLPPILNYLESVAPAQCGFLVGNAISVADISVASMFVNFAHARCAVDKGQYPRTYAWVDSILGRPSFAPVIETEISILARMTS